MGNDGCMNSLCEGNSFTVYNVYQIITLSILDISPFCFHYILIKLKKRKKVSQCFSAFFLLLSMEPF